MTTAERSTSGSTVETPFETPPDFGAAMEIADGVLWARLPLPMALDHVNVYAFLDSDGWTLIDTGINTRKCRAALHGLLSGPLAGAPLRRVIVTHHHPDHIGLAGWCQQELGAELMTTRTAWIYARMLQLDVQDVMTPESIAFFRSAGVPGAILEERRSSRPFNFADVVAHLPAGYTRIQEGDRMEFGGRTWSVHIGHGHAPEHATLWSEDDNLVLGGDQLLPSISPNIGVHVTEPEADPLSEWLEACTRLRTHARPDQLVLPGHKVPFTGLPFRLSQLLDHHAGALERLAQHLTTPQTAHDCLPTLFKRSLASSEYGLALAEALAHLNHLHKAGRASRQIDEDGIKRWQAT